MHAHHDSLTVKFWGTRASYPFFRPTHRRLGGDTSCVALRWQGHQLFIDAGTGLMHAEPTDGHDVILLSHFHLDHVLGLPYFLGKKKKGSLTLASAACTSAAELQAKLGSVYGGVGFPVSLSLIRPDMQWLPLPTDAPTLLGPWHIGACELNPPGTAFGYRVRAQQGQTSVVYLSDHEHGSPRDQALEAFARGAGLVIWDSSYDDRQFEQYKGWGHSTWQEGIRFARRCGARQLALSHHDPSRDDACAAELQLMIEDPDVFLACDGLEMALPQPDLGAA